MARCGVYGNVKTEAGEATPNEYESTSPGYEAKSHTINQVSLTELHCGARADVYADNQ